MFDFVREFQDERLEKLPSWQYYMTMICVTLGLGLLLLGMILASTTIFIDMLSISVSTSWEIAGIIGPIGAVLLLSSIPYSTPRVKDSVLSRVEVSFGIVVIAVILFIIQFPQNWNINSFETIALVSFLHLIGFGVVVHACLSAVIGFELRQTEGGEVKIEVSGDNERVESYVTESTLRDDPHYTVVEAVDELSSVKKTSGGGIGLIGTLPTERYETQTNRKDES